MSFSKSYIITEQIGAGAMATVSKAIQKSLERVVAVKQILPHFANNEEFVTRFHREAKAAAGLHHENIVSIIDFGNENDNYYIVVEYIDGPSLKELMTPFSTTGMPLPLALTIVTQMLYGLEHSHNKGIIHRDIKPANIMITSSGQVKVMDFGIAHAVHLPSLTTMGKAMGTPSYMSPEQAAGKKIDNRSDIFSVGVVLYELLCGSLPFKGSSIFSLLQSVVNDPHPPIKTLNPSVPDALVALVNKALEKDPTRRFFDATEFDYALDNFASNSSIRIGARVLREYLATELNLQEGEKNKFTTSQIDNLRKPSSRVNVNRPTVALLPLTGCFGCHVNLLDLHDEFGKLTEKIDLRFSYLMDVKEIPKVNIGIVEGCVANSENEERVKKLRDNCDVLIALGTCACYGGIPGLRNLHPSHSVIHRSFVQSESTDKDGFLPMPEYVASMTEYVKSVPDVVAVDAQIPGCPSPHDMIVSALDSPLSGTELRIPTRTVCFDCGREHKTLLTPKKEFIAPAVVPIMEALEIDPNVCFLEQGILCMGMATREGCKARCTKSNAPCKGCMGPAPMIRETGAKWINTVGSLLPTGALRFRDDIIGLGYRYTMPISMMPHRIDK